MVNSIPAERYHTVLHGGGHQEKVEVVHRVPLTVVYSLAVEPCLVEVVAVGVWGA